jgi:hypothetical protein
MRCENTGKRGNGKGEVGGGRWEVGSGRWEVGSGRWEVGGGKLKATYIQQAEMSSKGFVEEMLLQVTPACRQAGLSGRVGAGGELNTF